MSSKTIDTVTKPSKASLHVLEKRMKECPQVTIEPSHYFCPGIYAREIRVPAGTMVMGHTHKTAHINIISKGTIKVATEDGYEEIHAPHTMVCSAGTKRVGFAVTDVVWTTIHSNVKNVTDLVQLEDALIDGVTQLEDEKNVLGS